MSLRVWLLITLCSVSACSNFSSRHNQPPIPEELVSSGFTADTMMTATVVIATADKREQYLVAMRSVNKLLEFAFLSPQGVPQFSATYSSSGLAVSRQTSTSELLAERQLLGYLALMLIAPDDIQGVLDAHWRYQQVEQQRRFQWVGKAVPDTENFSDIVINYQSSGGRELVIKLTDRNHYNLVTIRILESSHVVPE